MEKYWGGLRPAVDREWLMLCYAMLCSIPSTNIWYRMSYNLHIRMGTPVQHDANGKWHRLTHVSLAVDVDHVENCWHLFHCHSSSIDVKCSSSRTLIDWFISFLFKEYSLACQSQTHWYVHYSLVNAESQLIIDALTMMCLIGRHGHVPQDRVC